MSKKEINKLRFKSHYINAVLDLKKDLDAMSDEQIIVFYKDNIGLMPSSNERKAEDVLNVMLFQHELIAETSKLVDIKIPYNNGGGNWILDFSFLTMVSNTIRDMVDVEISLDDLDNIISSALTIADQINILVDNNE